jgi:hypothetical protein
LNVVNQSFSASESSLYRIILLFLEGPFTLGSSPFCADVLGLIIFYENICKCCLEFVGVAIVLGTITCINVLFISEGTIFCSCWHKGDLQN